MKLLGGVILVVLLMLLLIFCCYLLSFFSQSGSLIKGSPFECGFSPLSLAGLSFSMPFFVVSLVFLLFDVEILLLCFYPFSFWFALNFNFLFFLIIFLIFFSTLYEWANGVLSWV